MKSNIVGSTTLQIWMELHSTPGGGEVEMFEEVLKAWFVVGRLGGYNGMNLQVGANFCHPVIATCAAWLLRRATKHMYCLLPGAARPMVRCS